jgi:hypothetical protein
MKKIAKKVLFALAMIVITNGLILAEGNDPKNVKKVSGQVIDKATGETLTGVKVFIAGTDKAAYSDFDGSFQIEYDVTKDTQISVELISYETKAVKIESSEVQKIELERQK